MLEYLRNAAEKPLAKILIGILAFSFVGWGVAEYIFGGGMQNANTLARVGGVAVTMQQFNMEKSRVMSNMTREQQRAVYADPAATMAFSDAIMSTLVTQQMANSRATDLGFVVSDARIAREIREFPEFQMNGQFSTAMFDAVLAHSGYTEADFANILRGQILRSMTLGSMSIPLPVTGFAADAMYNARHGMRDIEYATVKFSDFKAGTPTDAQLREFYNQNPHMIPEMRSISYVLIPADMSKPDSYDAAYKTAQSVEDDIIGGEPLSKAASTHKARFKSFKAFDAAHRPADELMTDAIVAKIFSMDEGIESELIETSKGFVIIRVDTITPAHNAEFDAVKKNLVADWTRDARRKQAYVKANELLVDLNKDGKLSGKKSATVSRTSGAPAAVLVSAFSSPVGTNAIIPDVDAFYVISVKSEKAPKIDTKNMANIKNELQNMSIRMLMDDYNSFLMRTYPIKINSKVYKRFFNQ